jgi:hypothetical protein
MTEFRLLRWFIICANFAPGSLHHHCHCIGSGKTDPLRSWGLLSCLGQEGQEQMNFIKMAVCWTKTYIYI